MASTIIWAADMLVSSLVLVGHYRWAGLAVAQPFAACGWAVWQSVLVRNLFPRRKPASSPPVPTQS
jgi:hypothetical protein